LASSSSKTLVSLLSYIVLLSPIRPWGRTDDYT
jgi:hypothetical protein